MARANLPKQDHVNRGQTATRNPGATVPRAKVPASVEWPPPKDESPRVRHASTNALGDGGGRKTSVTGSGSTRPTEMSPRTKQGRRARDFLENTRDVDGMGSGRGTDARLQYGADSHNSGASY